MYKNETRYALINGVLLDGTRDMTPQTGKIVCVEGGKIAAVTDGPVPAGYEPVDLAGRYVLPGLINLHVHLPASGKPKKKPSDPKKLVKLITSNGLMRRVGVKLCESYARTELLSGVTTIRTVGGVADFDTIIRDRAAAGEILSPRVVASNMAVSVPGGHMAGSLAYEARTPEEAAAYVERIAAEKPDLIKLMITGGVMDAEVVGEPGVLRMEPALVKAACDRAHGLGMKVAAHVESPEASGWRWRTAWTPSSTAPSRMRISCACSRSMARFRWLPSPPPSPMRCLTAASPTPPTSSRRTARWCWRA